MRGLSAYGCESLQKYLLFYYWKDETTETVPWITKNFRLSSVPTNDSGYGFSELSNSTSPGYAYFTFSGTGNDFVAVEEATGSRRAYFTNNEEVAFPTAIGNWQQIRQLCLFGIDGAIGYNPDPKVFIAGYDFSSPLSIVASSKLVFLQYSIKFVLN